MITSLVPMTCSITSEEPTSIATVMPARLNKGKFGGKSAFLHEGGIILLQRRSNQSRAFQDECAEEQTSIIGKKTKIPN